jgi:5-methyltetrahydrofolate--homocysteine methyltransferase
MSADAAKAGFEVLKSSFATNKQGADLIVLATVRGDIHDIGKNIVKALLENYGYRIIDLGKDVPVEDILAAVQKYDAKLLGLSALMTTTVTAMEATIVALHDTQTSVQDHGGRRCAYGRICAADSCRQLCGKCDSCCPLC